MSFARLKAVSFLILVGILAVSTGAAEDKPEQIVAAAKKVSDGKAWKVSAHIAGAKEESDLRISGIVFGKDYDLTVETTAGTVRHISVGDKSWTSADNGKTWATANAGDRRFYYLVHTPIHFLADEVIPPFEIVGPERNGNGVMQVRLKSPEPVSYEGDRPNWWILMENGRPAGITRYAGPAAFGQSYVQDEVAYESMAEKEAVVPPPGNPAAVVTVAGPGRLLQTALKNMSKGVWQVEGTAHITKTIYLHGLLSGKDYDLAWDSGPGEQGMRQIVIGAKCWINSPEKGWHDGSVDDSLVYSLAHTPIMSGRLQPTFEQLESSPIAGGTEVHLRLKAGAEATVDSKDLPQYWLMVDGKGAPLYVRKAQLNIFEPSRPNEPIACTFAYSPAKGKTISPPAKQ